MALKFKYWFDILKSFMISMDEQRFVYFEAVFAKYVLFNFLFFVFFVRKLVNFANNGISIESVKFLFM